MFTSSKPNSGHNMCKASTARLRVAQIMIMSTSKEKQLPKIKRDGECMDLVLFPKEADNRRRSLCQRTQRRGKSLIDCGGWELC